MYMCIYWKRRSTCTIKGEKNRGRQGGSEGERKGGEPDWLLHGPLVVQQYQQYLWIMAAATIWPMATDKALPGLGEFPYYNHMPLEYNCFLCSGQFPSWDIPQPLL